MITAGPHVLQEALDMFLELTTALRLVTARCTMLAAQALAPVLSSPKQPLQELQLGHNQLRDKGASALAQGLLRNSSLTKLSLGHNGRRARLPPLSA